LTVMISHRRMIVNFAFIEYLKVISPDVHWLARLLLISVINTRQRVTPD